MVPNITHKHTMSDAEDESLPLTSIALIAKRAPGAEPGYPIIDMISLFFPGVNLSYKYGNPIWWLVKCGKILISNTRMRNLRTYHHSFSSLIFRRRENFEIV